MHARDFLCMKTGRETGIGTSQINYPIAVKLLGVCLVHAMECLWMKMGPGPGQERVQELGIPKPIIRLQLNFEKLFVEIQYNIFLGMWQDNVCRDR